jgi:FHS family L-fucose permease-like MFS transporter
MQPSTLALKAQDAGNLLSYYWGGAMVGRFIGSEVLRLLAPGKVLAFVATGAITLILISANSVGGVSGWTLLAVGLMNSIMFPTIFSLASEGLGTRAAEGAGVIGVAIVGGAVIPPLTGAIADRAGLHFSLILPALCYAVILAYGIYARRPLLRPAAAAAVSH